ncbi:hypothetical protein [Herbaspirillum sp.]|uniref:hypothetical protein n=1 Tax=Herbaspirillum sp. TaxID=1890675 RepID=UPI001B0BD30B|nr:hypothetical protein [Herbaspirillum sp.]MBO9537856.1 hypothetical protein [Herbaspirillum sp.]
MPARHPFLLPLPCAAGAIALLAGAAAQAQSQPQSQPISEASLQSTYGQLEALRKELAQQKELLQKQRQEQDKPGSGEPQQTNLKEQEQLKKQEQTKLLQQELLRKQRQKQVKPGLEEQKQTKLKEQEQRKRQEQTKLLQQELLQTQRQKQLQTPQLEQVRKQVEQEGFLLRDMAHNLREPEATRNAPQPSSPAGNPSLATYLGAGSGNPQAQAQLSGAPVPGGVGSIGISPMDLSSALLALNSGSTAVITPGTISTGSLAPIVNGVQAMMNSMANISSSSSNGNASTSTNTSNPSSAVQDALQQSQQTSAVAAVQQSQQSQQLSYDYVTAGLVTPVASWPTSLLATYNGNISGALGSGAAVSGTIQATVDFARINGAQPAISGNIAFDGGRGGTNFTMTKMGTVLVGTMTGTYSGQSVTGTLNSQFYGPSAEQLAGQWYFQNTSFSVSGIGNFQARR